MRIILGSGSQRRKDILGIFFNDFDIIVPDIDESVRPGENPVDYALRVSEDKSAYIEKAAAPHPDETLIITSDTIVTIDDRIIGKPADHGNAVDTLRLLSGRTHRVISGMTLKHVSSSGQSVRKRTDYETTEVTFKKLTVNEIELYLSKIEYMDKAGSYAIQVYGDLIIQNISGSESNVIGFPSGLFINMLFRLNIAPELFKI